MMVTMTKAYVMAMIMLAVLHCCQLGLGLELENEEGPQNPCGEANAHATSLSSAVTTGALGTKRKRMLKNVPKKRRAPTALEQLVAGTAGGVSGVVASYPLDTVRIRMQTGGKHNRPLRVFLDLVKETGVRGIYRGIMSPVMGAGIIKGAVFFGYGLFQSFLRRLTAKDGQDLALWALGLAAMGSGFVGAFVVTPVERIKVVMQAIPFQSAHPNPIYQFFSRSSMRGGSRGYANVWRCAKGLVADQGIWKGLYAGLGPTLLRAAPGYAAYFVTYEAIKRFLLWRDSNSASSVSPSRAMAMLKTAMSGAIAGIVSWLPVYPVDVVKSRMQSAAAGGPGMFETAANLYRAEGISVFFRGLVPTLGRAVINHAATFVVYEAVMGHVIRTVDDGRAADEKEEKFFG